jgi:hypothetical protein
VDVYHFHGARLSMMNISVVEHEIAVAPGKLLFHLGELTGNIWLK